MIGLLIVGGAVVLMVLLLVLRSRADAKRHMQLAEVANGIGLQFSVMDTGSCSDPAFQLFQWGHAQTVSNVMTGTWQGLRLTAFDYRYVVGHGKNAQSCDASVVLVEVPARMPYVSVHRKGLFDRVAHFLGLPDIQVQSAAFNERFHIKSQNPEFAGRILDGAVAEVITRSDGKASIELCNGRLLVERGLVPARGVGELLSFAKAVHDGIPQDVLTAYR